MKAVARGPKKREPSNQPNLCINKTFDSLPFLRSFRHTYCGLFVPRVRQSVDLEYPNPGNNPYTSVQFLDECTPSPKKVFGEHLLVRFKSSSVHNSIRDGNDKAGTGNRTTRFSHGLGAWFSSDLRESHYMIQMLFDMPSHL